MATVLPPEMASDVLLISGITDIPPFGVVFDTGARSFLIFKKTDGQVLVIDVTEEVPPSFEQSYPATTTFWTEVATNTAILAVNPALASSRLVSAVNQGADIYKSDIEEFISGLGSAFAWGTVALVALAAIVVFR